MNLLLGHDQAVSEWVGSRVGKPFHSVDSTMGVLDRQGTLTGGMVFTGFNGTCIELSLAGKGDRSLWRAALDYVFDQLGCARLQIHTAADNRAVRRLAPRLGFTFEGKSRNFYGHGRDALQYSLTTGDLPEFRKRWRL